MKRALTIALTAWTGAVCAGGALRAQESPSLGACPVFPASHIWNTPVGHLPVDPDSQSYITSEGPSEPLHPDFGSGLYNGQPVEIPYVTVPGSQALVGVQFDYASESDDGGYPIPGDVPIEGGANSTGDRHALVIDRDNCILYELYNLRPDSSGGWLAGSGAIYDLLSYGLRPPGWTSADAAGLPIFAGLVRYDEVASGHIDHALRLTVPLTRSAYVWPARHSASNSGSTLVPPMGQRFRLKASVDISQFSAPVQVILQALKTYGAFVADNGSAWYVSGTTDDRWDNDVLAQMKQLHGSDLEAVVSDSLMLTDSTARANVPPVAKSTVRKAPLVR
jgi:hypothetical protein